MTKVFPIMTMAGCDPSGGAGMAADNRAIWDNGGFPMTVLTAITAQNPAGVHGVKRAGARMVRAQFDAVTSEIIPAAIKTGMLVDTPTVKMIGAILKEWLALHPTPLVVDPVMVATSGSYLLDDAAVSVIANELFPLATLITPNSKEARRLTGSDRILDQVETLRQMGARNILIKGGDVDTGDVKIDYLALENEDVRELVHSAVDTVNVHGTGCSLSASIATFLARGMSLTEAVEKGRNYVHRALEKGKGIIFSKSNVNGPCNMVN